MKLKKAALIFGYNEYVLEVARSLQKSYEYITIFRSEDEEEFTKEEINFRVQEYDLSDNWNILEDEYDIENSIVFCMIEDDAQNIFLTISLRSLFEDLTIIALSNSKESSNKLKMAGANKVIPVVETTANIMSDILKKPVATQILHDILYSSSSLKIAQIRVEKEENFHGKYPSDIEWHKDYRVLVISIIYGKDMKGEFIYSSKAKHHQITNGDIFVIVGYEKDIVAFESRVGSRCNVNWNRWSR